MNEWVVGKRTQLEIGPLAPPSSMPHILVDPESKSLDERFALIKTPRKNRSRYPEACVTPVADEQEARAGAEPGRNLHPALVYGPSKSSEGQRIYYLVRWLDRGPVPHEDP